eukprot:scaffold3100_cov403-Prasinococcus_capsulatus_cf.AAC.5
MQQISTHSPQHRSAVGYCLAVGRCTRHEARTLSTGCCAAAQLIQATRRCATLRWVGLKEADAFTKANADSLNP